MLLAISVNPFSTVNEIEIKPSQTLVYETMWYQITSSTQHTGLTRENPEWRLKMETAERLVGEAEAQKDCLGSDREELKFQRVISAVKGFH